MYVLVCYVGLTYTYIGTCAMQQCSHLPLSKDLLDAQDVYGRTPLMYCICFEAYDIARTLLRRGASRDVKDVMGNRALDIAINRGRILDEELLVLLSDL